MSIDLYAAFVAGFMASGEGSNGEILRDHGETPDLSTEFALWVTPTCAPHSVAGSPGRLERLVRIRNRLETIESEPTQSLIDITVAELDELIAEVSPNPFESDPIIALATQIRKDFDLYGVACFDASTGERIAPSKGDGQDGLPDK